MISLLCKQHKSSQEPAADGRSKFSVLISSSFFFFGQKLVAPIANGTEVKSTWCGRGEGHLLDHTRMAPPTPCPLGTVSEALRVTERPPWEDGRWGTPGSPRRSPSSHVGSHTCQPGPGPFGDPGCRFDQTSLDHTEHRALSELGVSLNGGSAFCPVEVTGLIKQIAELVSRVGSSFYQLPRLENLGLLTAGNGGGTELQNSSPISRLPESGETSWLQSWEDVGVQKNCLY